MAIPRSMKHRMLILLGMFLLLSASLVLRLGYLQVIRGPELSRWALAQWTRDVSVSPKRGVIYDRHMRELAVSATADTVVAIPRRIENPEETAAKLAAVLGISPETIYGRLVRNLNLVYLARKIPAEQAQALRALNLPGIDFKIETSRVYPNDRLASHILGFVGVDNQGLAGIELTYDRVLQGQPGEVRSPADGRNTPWPRVSPEYTPPTHGQSIVLTIDEVVQHILERELDVAMTRHQASGALAVAMNPKTGEILGMANRPDFDPNDYRRFPERLWRNTSVSDSFEPGSTFKVVTAAAALNEGVVTESDRFTCTGFALVAGVRLACWRARGHGNLNFAEMFWQSCNPSFVNIGTKLGRETLARYIDAFGFGRRTGVDLPGEARGVMFRRMGPVELATTSFGQGPAVTALQQVAAISAAVNGGTLFRPRLVREVRDQQGEVVETFLPEALGQAITAETSARVRSLLEGAVVSGSGRNAFIEGQRIGGKTGTAQVPRAGGGYYDDRYIASFIGMAPADDPSIVLLVIVREPKGPYGYFGSQVAAPTFRAMMADILRYLNVEPRSEAIGLARPALVAVPELRGLTTTAALAHLRDIGLNLRMEKGGNRVVLQTPLPGAMVSVGTTVMVELGQPGPMEGKVVVPDVRGQAMRVASLELANIGLRIIATGTGLAVSQDPLPGELVDIATAVRVVFRP
ncbi:MAG: Stage V sporulation protein D [Firmicutes bacterium]|nr:Stage V sporulation protein D [Bacillota bacterium]